MKRQLARFPWQRVTRIASGLSMCFGVLAINGLACVDDRGMGTGRGDRENAIGLSQ